MDLYNLVGGSENHLERVGYKRNRSGNKEQDKDQMERNNHKIGC